MIEVLGRAMDRASERHRTDLIYFGNLVRACVMNNVASMAWKLDAIEQSQR